MEVFFVDKRVAGLRNAHGITLLEVMVAMGIMVVGLLGMLALIPLGRMELAEAQRLDDASTIGRWAFRDLTVRGYLQPEMWVDPLTGQQVVRPDGSPTPDPYSLSGTAQPKARSFKVPAGALPPPYCPIVIDPLMLAPRFMGNFTNTTAISQQESSHRSLCTLFPYSLNLSPKVSGMPEARGDAPRIARVSLRTYPIDCAETSISRRFVMNYDVAQRFFRSPDDLAMDIPNDKSRRPVQIFALSPSSNVNVTPNDAVVNEIAQTGVAFRKFKGEYSWFFVAEPNMGECYDPSPVNAPATAGPAGSCATVRQYRVWTVVCHQRKLGDITGQTLSDAQGLGERMVFVDFIDRNTARLRTGGLSTDGAARAALDVSANQWIAVTGSYTDTVLNTKRYVMEWYRIIGVADDPVSVGNNMWYREVTLAGREFAGLGFSFDDADDDFKYPEFGNPMTGWGVIVAGARGVYEKTIYVDRPSLWSIRY